ncbi:MAG: feruloyl-CoA synthase [Alphaproteobacteria bacterium]
MDQSLATSAAPFLPVNHAEARASMTRRDNGEIIVEAGYPLGDYERNIVSYLHDWADREPDRVWMAQRDATGAWVELTYGEGLKKVNALSQALLDRGLDQSSPVMVLSANSINHALLVMAAMQVGVPAAPVAIAYSLMPGAHAKLHHVFNLVEPKLIFAEQGMPYAEALQGLDLDGVEVVVDQMPPNTLASTPFSDLMGTAPTDAVMDAFNATVPETVGKYLFTSGSTGMPKAVPQTQKMMCANMKAGHILFPPDPENPPVILDWLPWNHCYGGNSNFHGVLSQGGSYYIDEGRPLPGQIETTIENLRDIAPTEYLNVAAGHALVVHALEEDAELRKNFFSRLKGLAYGGASMPHEVWQRYQDLAVKETGHRILFRTGYGSTETAPVASSLHWPIEGTGNVGVPLPGTTFKLVPNGSKYEVRIKGDNVFTGYYRMPEKTAEAFDDEGFYKIGDALKLVDEEDITQGLIFDGRVVEDFKLLSGTFVSVGTLRVQVNNACAPAIADCIVCGHDDDYVGILAWPNVEACKKIAGADLEIEALLRDQKVLAHIRAGLEAHNKEWPGSSTRIHRLMLMAEPPSMEGHEITEKGYVNQRATLENRADLVKALYADAAPDGVIEV